MDWDDCHDKFHGKFCLIHTNKMAINHLESITYFQNQRSIDDYLDEFLDLIAEAGCTDPKTIVVNSV